MERLDRMEKLMEELILFQKEKEKIVNQTSLQMKETDLKFKETEKLIKELSTNIGGVSNSNGAYAEKFFYNALQESKTLGGIKFDAISKNVSFSKKGINCEFDIVMINGDSIGIIETKHKIKKDDIEDLITKKPINFRLLFPEFKNYKCYLSIGGMSFESKKIENQAHDAGIAILKQKGDILLIDDKNLKVY